MSESARDEDLVARAANGDQFAFGSLVERHQGRIYHVCLRIMGSTEDAQDASQDTFLTAMRKLSQFRGDAAFGTWLHRIAVNSCYDSLRRKKRRPLLRAIDTEDGPQPDLGPAAADHADEVAGTLDVAQALATISEDYRVVLVLADVQDLAYEEISRILDVPVGTVKSRVHRGRLALANALGMEPRVGDREPRRPSETSEGQS